MMADETRIAVVGGDEALMHALLSRYPRYNWLAHHPPMGVRTNPLARRAIVDFVAASDADLVLLAIGAPQSEMICHEIKHHGGARGTALCIGASLEFLAGTKTRAPRFMQQLGLEWLYRLLSEPRRLWRRYLVVGPRIFMIWWRWRINSGARPVDASVSIRPAPVLQNQDKSESSRSHISAREPEN